MRVIVWGLGVSGLSALKYLKEKTNHTVYIVNQGKPEQWPSLENVLKYTSKENLFDQSFIPRDLEVDQIILSPGVPRQLVEIQRFIDRGIEVISDVELAYRSMNCPVIAITGTNGKTTTTTMISEALSLCGKKVFTGGNIGIAACEYFFNDDFDIAVLELSSFQLESLTTFKANISIILNITENHMERYDSFSAYEIAKLNILNNQTKTDLFIGPKKYLHRAVNQQFIELAPVRGYDFTQSHLRGEHNLENLFCVHSVLKHLEIENFTQVIQSLINNFTGVAYRLEFVRKMGTTFFYNDAKSTNTASTLAAIRAFSGEKLMLILGGKVRDPNHKLLSDFKNEKIEEILTFGEAADLVESELGNLFKVEKYRTLSDIFKTRDILGEERYILFSPGFPSFDQYKNYIKRGEDFNLLVSSLT